MQLFRSNSPDQIRLYPILLLICTVVCSIFLIINQVSVPGLSAPGFPIDDGYIYSNYVREATAGRLFHYVPAEASGGVTGLLWYFLLIPVRFVVHLLTADELGRAVWPTYVLGVPLLAFLGLLVYQIGLEIARQLGIRSANIVALLGLLVLFSNPRMWWAGLSGLELPVSLVLVSLAVLLFLREAAQEGNFRGSAVIVGLLPWARPDLVVIGGFLTAVAVGGALLKRWSWRGPLYMIGSIAVFLAALMLTYFIGYGRPFPSSFYAKSLAIPVSAGAAAQAVASTDTGPLGLVLRIVSHNSDSLFAAGFPPLVLLLLAATRRLALPLILLTGLITTHFAAIIISIHGYSVESRYVLPVWPLVALLLVGSTALLLESQALKPLAAILSRRLVGPGLALCLLLLISAHTLYWATTTYTEAVRYSYDNDMQAGLWVNNTSAVDEPVAIGNAGLVATIAARHRRWVDVYGLVSPDLTDHVGNLHYIWDYLHKRDVRRSTVCWPDQPWVRPSPTLHYGCEFDWQRYVPASTSPPN